MKEQLCGRVLIFSYLASANAVFNYLHPFQYDCAQEIGWATPTIQAGRRKKRNAENVITVEKAQLHQSIAVKIPENGNCEQFSSLLNFLGDK